MGFVILLQIFRFSSIAFLTFCIRISASLALYPSVGIGFPKTMVNGPRGYPKSVLWKNPAASLDADREQ